MPDYTQLQKDYSAYRMSRAEEDLSAARLMLENGQFRAANNRAYYSIFHAIRALLVFNNVDSSKHSGVIAEFRRLYIKDGLLPVELSKMVGEAFTIRNASDYDDMFIASKDEALEQIEHAEFVCKTIKQFISDMLAADEA